MEKIKGSIKILVMFVIYLTYTIIFDYLFKSLGINNDTLVLFAGDLLFLLIIVLIYKNALMSELKELKSNFSLKKLILTILLWVGILFATNFVGGMLTEVLAPTIEEDANTVLLWNFEFAYTLFKVLIFAPIAEELLFKKSIRSLINNKTLYIIISSLIYALINIAYSNLKLEYMLIHMIEYFLFALISNILYVKHNNIVLVMIVKFCYNLIPLSLLLIGLGN